MHNSNTNFTKIEQINSINSCHKTNTSTPSKNENIEPLPESSRPRRDVPGGEDAK